MPDLKGTLDVALHEFNRIRTYVVEAKIVEHFDGGFKVFFSGARARWMISESRRR